MAKCPICGGTGDTTNNIPPTNEQWFCSLPTEEKAKVLRRKTYGNGDENEREEQGWVSWLKAKHEDNPPDIPSVPSWDRWLQGEKTKCEYCDGTNAGCNLVGRFECPKTPKTEQEYIQTCNTEQLADFIADVCYELLDDVWSNDGDTSCDYRETEKNYWVEWLKQPHNSPK